MSEAIATVNLSKTFCRRRFFLGERVYYPALTGLNLQVKKGEIFALLGPNGAGKTTLIKILCGLIQPTAGVALVNGNDVARDPRKVRADTGYCLDSERSFYYRISGRENLAFFAALNNMKPQASRGRIGDLLDMLGLGDMAEQPFMNYSAGQKQRLNLARALLHDPAIVIMDEPTKSLDPEAAEGFWRVVAQLAGQDRERTIFFATHNLKEVENVCSSAAFIKQGSIIRQGALPEIKAGYGNTQLQEIYREIMAGEGSG